MINKLEILYDTPSVGLVGEHISVCLVDLVCDCLKPEKLLNVTDTYLLKKWSQVECGDVCADLLVVIPISIRQNQQCLPRLENVFVADRSAVTLTYSIQKFILPGITTNYTF